MKATYKIYQRASYRKKNGENPLYLRLTINRISKVYSLNISCTQDQFNLEKLCIRITHPDHENLNKLINSAKIRADKIIFDYSINNKLLTFVDFEKGFFAPIFESDSFYSYVKYAIKESEGILAKDTIRFYYSQLSKLKNFRQHLSFSEISSHFLDAYKMYMIKELSNVLNTCNKSTTFVKVMLNRAVKDGAIKINPVNEYKIKRVQGTREYLTIQELQKLEGLMKEKIQANLRNVLKYFLFACYTGLRYQDIKDIRYGNINTDMIILTMHKTKDRVIIPLIPKAKVLINTDSGFPEQKIFKVFVNQVTNRYLKDLAEKAKISKKISFHSSRHTFAVCSLEYGIPIEIVSSLLGHKDLKTTQIYAKIMDYKKIEAMKKWDLN